MLIAREFACGACFKCVQIQIAHLDISPKIGQSDCLNMKMTIFLIWSVVIIELIKYLGQSPIHWECTIIILPNYTNSKGILNKKYVVIIWATPWLIIQWTNDLTYVKVN